MDISPQEISHARSGAIGVTTTSAARHLERRRVLVAELHRGVRAGPSGVTYAMPPHGCQIRALDGVKARP